MYRPGRVPVAVLGSGNIGTDLMMKILQGSRTLAMAALVGVDPASDELARAQRLSVPTTSDGVTGLVAMPGFERVRIVFDATSAGAHRANALALASHDVQLVDLTPAALGPYTVPAVNLEDNLQLRNVNMVTCGGQATIPVVAAVSRVVRVLYAEIVASIASRSAGPGTRANIDEFTETTSRAVEQVGGARRGKAIIVLNPADPPLVMRDTVLCLTDRLDPATEDAARSSITGMVAEVAEYVPGYRLKHAVQFTAVPASTSTRSLGADLGPAERTQVGVLLEVEGAGHYLPAYAGNLDIMTAAALRVGERMAEHVGGGSGRTLATAAGAAQSTVQA